MFLKVALLTAAVLLSAQSISAQETSGYFEIDGAVYYFDEESDFYPDEAQAACEALGMTLIRFENIEKWYSILAWADQGHEFPSFWTGAVRDENSSVWYWAETGAPLTDIFWGYTYPGMESDSVKAAIAFSNRWDGMGDFHFNERYYSWGIMCQ